MALTRKAANGYIGVAAGRATKLMHVAIAEAAIGKPLPRGAIVHHIDGDKANNALPNLVVCPDQAYHKLIHQRADALAASGHAHWLKCKFCGAYDDPDRLRIYSVDRSGRKTKDRNIHHAACNAAYLKARYQSTKEKRNG